MKRLTAILAAGALFLAPLSVSAMEMMEDSSMKDVTGQAGVSIGIDDVVLYQESIADTTYWDTDGNGDVDTEEYGVEISYDNNVKKLTTIDAIVDNSRKIDVDGNEHGKYANAGLDEVFSDSDNDFDLADNSIDEIGIDQSGSSPLTIDVGVAETLTDGLQYNEGLGSDGNTDAKMAGVIIGLPTVEITNYHTEDRRTIGLTASNSGEDDGTVNADADFIDIEQSGTSQMAVLGGTVEIAPH